MRYEIKTGTSGPSLVFQPLTTDQSRQSGPVPHRVFRLSQNHLPILTDEPRRENLRHKAGDLARREVGDADHLPSHQFLGRVKPGDLRAGLLHPKFPEVDPELIGRLPGLRKLLSLDDRTDAEFHPLEFFPGYLLHALTKIL